MTVFVQYHLYTLVTRTFSVMVCVRLELLRTDERKFQPESLKYVLFSGKGFIVYSMII